MKWFVFISILFLTFFNIGFSQGESAVPFLLISPGARAGGMGEAGVALASDATAVFWNPAGLAFQYEDPEEDSRGEVSFMHVKWLPQFNFDDLFFDYLAGRYYVEDIGMFGGSITFLNLGKNVYTNDQGDELGTFDSFEYAITASYATKLKQNLSMGVNIKFIHSHLFNHKDLGSGVGAELSDGMSSSFAVDVGVLWIPAYEFFKNKFSFGANLSNFGPKMTYIDEAQADPLPTNLKLGVAYKLLDDDFNRITLVYDINRLLVYRDKNGADGVIEAAFYSVWVKQSLKKRLQKFIHSIGLEYWYGNLIALRTGYFYEHENAGGRKFLTFGGGIKYSIFGFDFGYISAEEDHPLSDTMRFSVLVHF